MQARTGMPIDSTDGAWGELDDFVVDPTTWNLTHLVVQPHRHHERSRLVPSDQVVASTDRLVLSMSPDEIERCPVVEVTEFIRVDRPSNLGNGWSSDEATVSAWPYYPYVGADVSMAGTGFIGGFSSITPPGPHYASTSFDHVPAGKVEIRRTSEVVSSDEHSVGTVDGFVFDADGQITHLVLEHGHLWARRDVTIPIAHAVKASYGEVHLDVTGDEVGEFPSVSFHRHGRVTS